MRQIHWTRFNSSKTGPDRWETPTNKEIQARAAERGRADLQAKLADSVRIMTDSDPRRSFHDRLVMSGKITNNTRWNAGERGARR